MLPTLLYPKLELRLLHSPSFFVGYDTSFATCVIRTDRDEHFKLFILIHGFLEEIVGICVVNAILPVVIKVLPEGERECVCVREKNKTRHIKLCS